MSPQPAPPAHAPNPPFTPYWSRGARTRAFPQRADNVHLAAGVSAVPITVKVHDIAVNDGINPVWFQSQCRYTFRITPRATGATGTGAAAEDAESMVIDVGTFSEARRIGWISHIDRVAGGVEGNGTSSGGSSVAAAAGANANAASHWKKATAAAHTTAVLRSALAEGNQRRSILGEQAAAAAAAAAESATGARNPGAAGDAGPAQQAGGQWLAAFDPNTGKTFYYHRCVNWVACARASANAWWPAASK